MTALLLEAESVGRFDPRSAQWLLRDISCNLSAGEVLALTGPTGAGKTLLLRALSSLDSIDEGEIRLQRRPIAEWPTPQYRGKVMYVAQQAVLLPGTVEENLRRPFQLQVHQKKRFDRDRMVRLLQALGRDASFLESSDSQLSGGEASIVTLLRALQLDPLILLLDEPTSALDTTATQAVEKLIAAWMNDRPESRAAIWVSHDLDQAERVSQRQMRLQGGMLHDGN